MQIGDRLEMVPTFDFSTGFGSRRAVPCTVVYIHPEGRYITVEFTSELGQRWKESFLSHSNGPLGEDDSELLARLAQDNLRRQRHVKHGNPGRG